MRARVDVRVRVRVDVGVRVSLRVRVEVDIRVRVRVSIGVRVRAGFRLTVRPLALTRRGEDVLDDAGLAVHALEDGVRVGVERLLRVGVRVGLGVRG